ncbi:MAG: hypothetical protein AB4080_22630 [Trichodesmium sp.]
MESAAFRRKSPVQESGGKKEEERIVEGESFFVRALIPTRNHASNHQRRDFLTPN